MTYSMINCHISWLVVIFHGELPCMTVDKKQKNAALESSEQSIRSFFSSDRHKHACDRSSSATIKYTYLCSLFDKHQKGARVRIMWKNIMIRYMVIESHSDTIKENFICLLFSFLLDSCLVFSYELCLFFSCLFLSSRLFSCSKSSQVATDLHSQNAALELKSFFSNKMLKCILSSQILNSPNFSMICFNCCVDSASNFKLY